MELGAIPGRLADPIIATRSRQYVECATTFGVGVVAGSASRFLPHHRIRKSLEMRRRRYWRAVCLLRRRGHRSRGDRNGTEASRQRCTEGDHRNGNPRSASVLSRDLGAAGTPNRIAEVSATAHLTNRRHQGNNINGLLECVAGVSQHLQQAPLPRAWCDPCPTVSPAPTATRQGRTGGCGCTV